jgi:hypothetical protein
MRAFRYRRGTDAVGGCAIPALAPPTTGVGLDPPARLASRRRSQSVSIFDPPANSERDLPTARTSGLPTR